jgi:hypothetical protein
MEVTFSPYVIKNEIQPKLFQHSVIVILILGNVKDIQISLVLDCPKARALILPSCHVNYIMSPLQLLWLLDQLLLLDSHKN